MTPQALKSLMEIEWQKPIAFANNRTRWQGAALGGLRPKPGRPLGLLKMPRRYLPLYRQPRLGLPKRPRKCAATKH